MEEGGGDCGQGTEELSRERVRFRSHHVKWDRDKWASSLGVTRTSDKYLGFPEYEGDLRHEQLGPTQV